MKDKAASMISSKQLIFVIIGTQIGAGIFALPRTVSAESGDDAWISVILGAIIPLISVFLIDRMGRKMPETGFTQMSQALLGKIMGSFIILLFVAYAICFQSLVVRVYAEVAKMYLLPQTPLIVVLLFFVFPVYYIGSKGARVIGRLNEIFFYILLLLFTFLIISLTQADFTNIMPIGESGLKRISQGALATTYAFGGTDILLVLYFLVNRKEEVLKAGFTAIGLTTLFYFSIVITCLVVFGDDSLQRIVWPGLMLLKVSQVPVIERLEFVFLFLWMGMGARPAINMAFAASLSLSQLLRIDVNKYGIYSLLFISSCIYILALIPRDLIMVFDLWNFAGYSSLVVGLGYPLLFLIMSLIRGGKGNA